MKEPFEWDDYSDQPAQLKDKTYKKTMRKRQLISLLKTTLTALIVLPISLVLMPFVKRKEIVSKDFFCMGIDFQREPKETLQLINDLGVQRVLLRFKLWEMQSLDMLKEYLLLLKSKKVTLKILQDRENIEDLALLKNNLNNIFSELNGLVDIYEIGSTTNRAKWGFFSVDEYNKFYQVAFELKKSNFPDIQLIGSGVIDFEYHFTAHTLFNFFKYKYNGISSLLYVDRRGAPENTQLGFTLSDKIAWLNTLVWLSPKVQQKLHITETNWPITDTAPYAPTSEHECVSEKAYANFMLRYHLLTFASQQVDSLSWHQLIAPGYGLIDNREGLVKREAFNTYKYMYETLNSAQFLRLDIKRDYYILQFMINDNLLQIHWSLVETTLENEDFFIAYSKNGEKIEEKILIIGESPLYLFITKAAPEKINCI
jgi:hypothetical protein